MGTGASRDRLRKVDPADRARRIDEELRRTRDVPALRSGLLVEQVIAPNHLGADVGEEGERVPLLATEFAIDLGRIDADRDQAQVARVEIGEAVLKTPQLGVAERSPIAPVEDEDRSVDPVRPACARVQQLRERDRIADLVGQREVRGLLTDLRRAGRRRQLSQEIEDVEAEETKEGDPQDEEDRPLWFL